MDQTCEICGAPIIMLTYRNTGVCCEQCRKIRDNMTHPDPGPVASFTVGW